MNFRTCVMHVFQLSNFMNKNTINVRNYTRWAHRRPARVLTPEEYENESKSSTNNNNTERNEIKDQNIIELNPEELTEKPTKYFKLKQKKGSSLADNVKEHAELFDIESLDAQTHFINAESRKTKNKGAVKANYTKTEILNTTFDEEGNYVYTKMKDNDPKIGTLMLMVKSRKLRKRKECILLEGKLLIKDALEAGCVLQHLLFSRKTAMDAIRDLLPKKNIQLYKMAYRDMQMWSDLTTCPGIMGIFKVPDESNIKPSKTDLPVTIICDNIREPGNLGTILRASAAVGAEKIILTKGCVDLWEPKVLRSACGAHFRSPISSHLNWEKIKEKLPDNVSVFLADNNLATSEVLSKQNLESLFLNVPILPYYGINFAECKSIVLIIGGETLGLSEESYKLASDRKGVRLNVPLSNNIESLNAGTALGVIAFEIRRQLTKK